MKRFWRGLIGAAMGLAVLAQASAALAELRVVVTIKPIHSLVTQVMEGIGTPDLLVSGSNSPHTFSLKPSNVRAINAADVFIRVSEAVEPFTGKIKAALPETVEVVTLEDAPGLELLDIRSSGTFEMHADHDEDAHGHGDEDGEGVHHGAKDGHIWLDPDNAKAIVNYVANVLAKRAPNDAARIEANATRLNARIDALTAELDDEMRPLRGKPFVVFHDAYQYFEKRFGLDAVGSITTNPTVRPSAKRLTELRQKIRSLDAGCVFAEPFFQPKLIAAVTEGTNARSGTLDPLGVILEPGPKLYFELMRALAAGLTACLDPGSQGDLAAQPQGP